MLITGRHVISLTIMASERNAGFMYLGLLGADDQHLKDWPQRRRKDSQQHWPFSAAPTVGWAFCPLNGHLHTTESPSRWGSRGRKLMAGDLSGQAVGAVVELHVDMDARTLGVAVNEGDVVDAQVELPASVRPWVLLAHQGDAVVISGYRGAALLRSAVAAEEWLRFALPPCLREHARLSLLEGDPSAAATAADYMALGQDGLVTEAMLALLNATHTVARTSAALLGRLLQLEVLAPLSRRLNHFLRPPDLSIQTAAEPTYVILCMLPDLGLAPSAEMLADRPSKPHSCTLSFLSSERPRVGANVSAAAAAAAAADATSSDAASGFFNSTPSASALASALASAAPAPPHATAVIPSAVWTLLLCRCLLASDLTVTPNSPPPKLSSCWALLSFGDVGVELRRLGVQHIRISIWDPQPAPIALCIATLAAQAASAARLAASSPSDGLGALTVDGLDPVLTVKPHGAKGAAFDLETLRSRLLSHQRLIDRRTGEAFSRAALEPWIGSHGSEQCPDLFLLCRTPSADTPLTALLHLMLSRTRRAKGREGGRPTDLSGGGGAYLAVHLDHAALMRAARGTVARQQAAEHSASMAAMAEVAAGHAEGTGGGGMRILTLGDTAKGAEAALGAADGGVEGEAVAMAAATAMASSVDLKAITSQLKPLSGAMACVPIISHASIAPLRYMNPANGQDWADPMLLQWSLALELYHSGWLSGLAPVLVGLPRADGAVERFELDQYLPRRSPGAGRARLGGWALPGAGGGDDATNGRFILSDGVSMETYAMLQRVAAEIGLEISAEARTRSIRDTVVAIVRSAEALQWSDLLDSLLYVPPPPVEWGGPGGPESGDGGREAGLAQELAFQRVCAHHFVVPRDAASLSRRDEAGANPQTARALDVPAQFAALTARLEGVVRSGARRAALNEQARGGLGDRSGGGKAAGRGGEGVGISVEELLRTLGDPTGLEKLLSVARLAPSEHTRAVEQAKRWCSQHSIETVDDLLGGGTSLQADAALWDEFVSALRISSPVLSNRIRRELLRRRAELVEKASRGRGHHGILRDQMAAARGASAAWEQVRAARARCSLQ